MNTELRIPQALSSATATEPKAVCLNPVALNQAYRTIREIFFPDWQARRSWAVELESGKPYLMCCNYATKTIGITKAHFTDRDELRAILIVQLCIARLGYDCLGELGTILKYIETRAAFIQRDKLASFLAEARCILASPTAAEMSWDSHAVTTYDWPSMAVDHDQPAHAFDTMFTDSLADRDIQRILAAEKKYIRGRN